MRARQSCSPVMDMAPVRAKTQVALSMRASRAARTLPTPSSMLTSRGRAAPKGRGRSVSSMEKPAMPAASTSCAVRAVFIALP